MNREEQLDFLINYLIDERNEAIEIPQDYDAKRNLFRSLVNVRMPLKISDEFLKVQDEFLTDETLSKNLTCVEDIKDVDGKIMLWQGDIVTLKVDAIVNAANSKLLGCFIPLHNCIDNMIHSAAGVQLREECNRIMQLQGQDEDVGNAKIKRDCEALKSCYVSCLEIASQNNLESLAFCAISTGVFNFPRDLAAEIAVGTVVNYLDSNETSLKHVIFDVFSDDSYETYRNLLF